MAWCVTTSVEDYLVAAGEFLVSQPTQNTVLLTVTETLRAAGPTVFGEAVPLFGWWLSVDGSVTGAFLHTPPSEVLLTALSPRAAEALAAAWPRERPLTGVNATEETAGVFASSWGRRAAIRPVLRRRERLYRLGDLVMPRPGPPGRARVAGLADSETLVAWVSEFQTEIHGVAGDTAKRVADRLSYNGFTFWEVAGRPVAVAGVSRSIHGMVRIGPVYTPPDFRRLGHAGAVTAAVSKAALKAGARDVLLFADRANSTSNGVYRRLGFEPVEDHVVLRFAATTASSG